MSRKRTRGASPPETTERSLSVVEEVIDGTLDYKVEAVYYRYFKVYAYECENTDEAISYLCAGSEYGYHAPVGVFVDGEPVLVGLFVWDNDDYTCSDIGPPDEDEMKDAAREYAKVQPE